MASGVTSASFAATRVGGRYWTGVFGTEHPPTIPIAILVILLVAAVNYRGVGESIKVNIVITLIELSGLLFIVLIGAKVLFSGDGDPGQALEFKESGFGALTGMTAGAATAFYAFIHRRGCCRPRSPGSRRGARPGSGSPSPPRTCRGCRTPPCCS
jgi:APA family basic amino acid/polyamine antiporter